MWQLTMYCHWRPPDAMHAIANLKCFGAPVHQRPNFDGFIYIRYVVPPYSVRISAIYLPFGSLVGLRLQCATPGNETKRRIYEGRVKTPVLIYAVCELKFIKFWDNVGDPPYFTMPLPNCLCHVSFKRYLPLSLEVVEKPNKCKSFWPSILLRITRLFYGRLLARFTVHRLPKFGWVSFADLRPRSLATK